MPLNPSGHALARLAYELALQAGSCSGQEYECRSFEECNLARILLPFGTSEPEYARLEIFLDGLASDPATIQSFSN